MQIGISTECDSDFYESASYPPREAVLYEAELPSEVIDALKIIRNQLNIPSEKIPVAEQDFHGHGCDYGLVFREDSYELVEIIPSVTNFTTKNLVARVSFGMEKTGEWEENERKTCYKDPKLLNRLHLNVFGSRQFLPKNFREIQEDREHFSYLSERVHFSLRWLKGEFDGCWNDFGEFEKNVGDYYLNVPKFNEKRTTYMSSGLSSEYVNGNFSREGESGKIITLEKIYQLLGTKNRILPKNLTREEILSRFSPDFDPKDLEKVFPSFDSRNSFENIGFTPVLKILSQFGEVSERDELLFPKMKMQEGVEYIFDKVLPAMKKYTEA